MRDKYTVAQVLFALREIYQEYLCQIQALDKHFVLGKGIKDINLFLLSLNPEEMGINLIYDETILNRILLAWEKMLGIYHQRHLLILKPDFEGTKTNRPFTHKRILTIVDSEAMRTKLRNLFDSDFVRNINSGVVYQPQSEGIGCHLTWYDMKFWQYGKNVSLQYAAADDSLSFKSAQTEITRTQLMQFLSLYLAKDNFSPYVQDIVENYKHKEIIIPSTFSCHEGEEIMIDEGKKEYILVSK